MGLLHTFYRFFHHDKLRDAVRRSYSEHRLHPPLPAVTPPHRAGLHGALRARYTLRGQPANGLSLWAELTPFLLMTEETSCEALAEYVVYQESPSKARVPWLTQVISASLRLPALSKNSPRTMASQAMIKNVAWCNLLEHDVRDLIEQEMADCVILLLIASFPCHKTERERYVEISRAFFVDLSESVR